MVQPRPGPADATPALGRPLGLAVRLQRGSLIGWAAGVLLFAFVYGALVHSIKDFIADNQSLADFLAKVGGARTSLTDAYLATTFRTLALIATGFVVQSVLRVRGEETAGRAEPVLATPVSRTRWAAGHLVVALIGTVLVLVGSGLAVGVTYGVTGGGIHVVPGLVGASVVYFPAMGVMLGVSALLVGVAPRATALAWAYAALCFVIGFLGELLKVPQWLADVSPFAHIPQLPAHGVSVLPLVVITAVAAAFTAVGLVGLRRRDVGAVG